MKNSLSSKHVYPTPGVLAIVALLVIPMARAAEPPRAEGAALEGYWTRADHTIVTTDYGECWHTDFWLPEHAVAGCDPVPEQAEAPPPAPVVAEPPPPSPEPAVTQVYFEFDRFELDEQDLSAIAAVVKRIAEDSRLRVDGYADRIGTDSYNRLLSQRRAEAVRERLIQAHGIAAERIEVRAFGETLPQTQCSDKLGWKALVSCLQPDRRAEIHELPAL